MREDLRVEALAIGVTVLVAVLTVWRASRAGADDPNWELRWRALDPEDRARLAVAGLSGASTTALADPEERALAEGFGRRENRRRAYLDLVLLIALAFTAALMLIGLTNFSSLGLILGAYALLRWPVDSFRESRIKGRVQTEPDTAR